MTVVESVQVIPVASLWHGDPGAALFQREAVAPGPVQSAGFGTAEVPPP
ncbi:hypothetical protein LAUMK191_05175 [Mycobacterium attenuatum]|uniref:Uncharacterized protein n=1 Tax=Mycobacterium attenuatum TaxID=2341086 RepID=A0A498QFM4_9MYCO|nr:hypothetical protein LAUMK136_05200 [Mycobacterium attenuatum]VBA59771.1 hypothetical protein LAUMK191_05175 [Mycobacterium attenuatum]VBA61956.1 hypothetical protein LAUMK41_05341 [Mycobacterium attenuatum]